jgi:hypothetical protein
VRAHLGARGTDVGAETALACVHGGGGRCGPDSGEDRRNAGQEAIARAPVVSR